MVVKRLMEEKDNYKTATTQIEPYIFNKNGDRKRTFYLDDRVCVHSPYSFSSINVGETHYINWDRFNKGLRVHFYSHEKILDAKLRGKKNFGIIVESETIVPALYSKLLSSPNIISRYDGIFTHSERLLNRYSNTYFIPGSSVWYGGTAGGGELSCDKYKNKNKNISLVSSDKAQCDLHRFRLHLAELLSINTSVDVMGTYNGGNYVNIADSLDEYRYSIVIENNITSCYFTEKILNCFAAMTIPIYIGATDIGKYFDSRGIVSISPSMSDDEIIHIINMCTPEFYSISLDAIKNNYEYVKKYFCIEDYIYENYLQLFE